VASPDGGARRGDSQHGTWIDPIGRLSAVAAIADRSRRRSLHVLVAAAEATADVRIRPAATELAQLPDVPLMM
jgi:hypothetical protein